MHIYMYIIWLINLLKLIIKMNGLITFHAKPVVTTCLLFQHRIETGRFSG